jgi:hypothetical protein
MTPSMMVLVILGKTYKLYWKIKTLITKSIINNNGKITSGKKNSKSVSNQIKVIKFNPALHLNIHMNWLNTISISIPAFFQSLTLLIKFLHNINN